MPQVDPKKLSAALKNGEPERLYYVFGQDINSVERMTRKIIKTAVGDDEELALNRLDGKSLDISAFRDMAEMMPMLSERNCILVNDFNCEEKKEEQIKRLLDALKDIPETTVIIFNVTGFQVKTKYDRKKKQNVIADKNKKLADVCAKNGVLVEFAVRSPGELAKEIAVSVSARGGMISLKTAEQLADMCLSDTLAIRSEVDKLCAYAGGREITAEMLRQLVPHYSSANVFELADAVASFNRKAAFEALDELMADKSNRGVILANITNSFLDLYRVRCARQSGRTADQVKQDFGYYNRGFVIDRLYRGSQRISIERLRKCIVILRDTSVKLNSTSSDEKIVLEQMVTEMLMTR